MSKGYTGDGSFSLGNNNNNPTLRLYIDRVLFSSTTSINNEYPSIMNFSLNPATNCSMNVNQTNYIDQSTT